MSSPASTPSTPSPASTRVSSSSSSKRHSSTSSIPSVSLAFSSVAPKRSPRLQASRGVVECSSTDRGALLLQPKSNGGPLNGLFVADEERRVHEKDDDKKVGLQTMEF